MRRLILAAVMAACGHPESRDVDGGTSDDSSTSEDAAIDSSDGAASLGWIKSFPGPALHDVAVAADGSIVIVGIASGAFTFGGESFGVNSVRTLLVAKLAGDGTHVWAKGIRVAGSTGGIGRAAVAVSQTDGAVHIAANATGVVDLGAGPMAIIGSQDVLLVKVTADGSTVTGRRLGGADAFTEAADVAIDSAGNVFVVGFARPTNGGGGTTETINLGGSALVGTGAVDAWAASFTSDLTSRWSRKLGAPTYPDANTATAIVVDPVTQAPVALGQFRGTTNFGGIDRTSAGLDDLFVLTLVNASGAHATDAIYGGTGSEFASDLAISGNSHLIAGTFNNTTSIGGITRTASGFRDGFVSRVTGSTAAYLMSVGSANRNASVNGITPAGTATGTFADIVTIGGTALQSPNRYSGFAARLSTSGSATWTRRYGEVLGAGAYAVAEIAGGTIVIGDFDGKLVVDGVELTTPGSFVHRLVE